jgi:hypothetical protein
MNPASTLDKAIFLFDPINPLSTDKQISSDPEIQELLERLALLEYANDNVWCDVHPIVLREVEERIKREDPGQKAEHAESNG